jgi:hypothetical protein
MKRLCLVCELWLVELSIKGGEVNYWCERCHQEAVRAKTMESKSLVSNGSHALLQSLRESGEKLMSKKHS